MKWLKDNEWTRAYVKDELAGLAYQDMAGKDNEYANWLRYAARRIK